MLHEFKLNMSENAKSPEKAVKSEGNENLNSTGCQGPHCTSGLCNLNCPPYSLQVCLPVPMVSFATVQPQTRMQEKEVLGKLCQRLFPHVLRNCMQVEPGAGSLSVRGSWRGLPEEAAPQGTTNQVPRVMAEQCPRWDLCQLFPAICSAPAWLCNLPAAPLHRQPHRPSQKCWCCLQRLKS